LTGPLQRTGYSLFHTEITGPLKRTLQSGLESRYNQRMATRPTKRATEFDIIEPIGKRVVIRKDDNKRETKSGIVLPDSHEIPVITGRVIAVSKAIENDEDQTIRQYDKVLFDPREAIPVELEHDNRMFVVAIDRVLAIFRRSDQPKPIKPKKDDDLDIDGEEQMD
jgi:chaperonin GroES